MSVLVRRITASEWREVKALRLSALADPIAHLAFLDTLESATAQPDEFWVDRARGSGEGEEAAQFVAVDADGEWVGTSTVIAHRERSDAGLIVGVYVIEDHRGSGLVERLFSAVADWSAQRGWSELVLDVHVDNPRARGAYERLGFEAVGEPVVGDHGAEQVMRRAVAG